MASVQLTRHPAATAEVRKSPALTLTVAHRTRQIEALVVDLNGSVYPTPLQIGISQASKRFALNAPIVQLDRDLKALPEGLDGLPKVAKNAIGVSQAPKRDALPAPIARANPP